VDVCTVEMSDHNPCGRLLYARSAVASPEATCLMHHPGAKPAQAFQGEVDALLARKSLRNTLGVADFKEFHFPSGVDFSGRVFSDPACFRGAVFEGSANFSRARFAQDAIFVQATFADVDFSSAIFEGNGIFARVTFGRKADFSNAALRKTADFKEAKFEGFAGFWKAELNAPAFESSAFAGNASFISTKFSGPTNFNRVAFHGEASFSHSSFSGPADFEFVKCFGTSNFSEASFDEASFAWAEFVKGADFRLLLAERSAAFSSTKFQDVTFESAHFRSGASFDSATFSGDVEFTRSAFGPGLSVGYSAKGRGGVADFSGAKFEKPTKVWFSQVNKSVEAGLRARFLNCDVENIHLEDVHWHRRRSGRMVLQDELDLVDGAATGAMPRARATGNRSGFELVAIVYRQLINNFDKVRALDLAEDCFCGAMEMKRRDPGEAWPSRAVLSAYKFASSYGSNYVQALLVLAAIVIAMGLTFAIPSLGLGPSQGNPGAVQMASSWLRRCPAGLFHSLQVAAFQRDAVYAFTLRRGRLMVTAEQVIVPVQAALLLLALRRRFRR
jgi:uncharacterized protein YjbI with pentapeptide repeats